MIRENNKLFALDTPTTSYLFQVNETGHLEHLHYGRKFQLQAGDLNALEDKHRHTIGDEPAYDEDHPTLFLENLPMEYSTEGKGDYRVPMVVVDHDGGFTTLDFIYQNHLITAGKQTIPHQGAQAYGSVQNCMSLRVELRDSQLPIFLVLSYTVFEDSDVILRFSQLINKTDHHIYIRKLDSLQLDLSDANWDLVTFNGAWARERIMERAHLRHGSHVNESRSGLSSSDHNPLLLLARPDATEKQGEVIGYNLIYSGNHKEEVEVSPFGKTRLVGGINESAFLWKLPSGSTFTSPEAILTYSTEGFEGVSTRFHRFVNEHIVRGVWKWRERPVLCNSWEAAYFDFDENKLLNLARSAAALGAELFVVDDGWFGSRNDDTSSLGDWFPSPQKIPSGLSALSDKIHNLGMMFGLWIEPEMVNKESQLYLKHPDWVIAIPGRKPSVGRHQYILDLTRKEVRDYLYDAIGKVFSEADVNYVKWDCNRLFTDLYTVNDEVRNMGEFPHRYVLGLYELLDRFTKAFPNVLFEGCASGGQRFDLGMLCYVQQIWCSDNTDALDRIAIQEGTSYGYPLSAIGCHVSTAPNHQTLRMTSLETRANIAFFGAFGYEMDLGALSREEKQQVREQIAFFKQFRAVFQYGTFHRNRHGNITQWTVVSQDKRTLLVLWNQERMTVNGPNDILLVPEAEDGALYEVLSRPQELELASLGARVARKVAPLTNLSKNPNATVSASMEHYLVSGGLLKYAGIKLPEQFLGCGFDADSRILGDMGGRIYLIRKQ